MFYAVFQINDVILKFLSLVSIYFSSVGTSTRRNLNVGSPNMYHSLGPAISEMVTMSDYL